MDGAVVLTKRFELLGFGAEIAVPCRRSSRYAARLDLEGERFVVEDIDGLAPGIARRSASAWPHQTPSRSSSPQDGGCRSWRTRRTS